MNIDLPKISPSLKTKERKEKPLTLAALNGFRG
jgi:hypothetical protein